MAIIVSEPIASKGKADAKRHRDKQQEVWKKHLPDIIAEESIIKSDTKGKIVKIPIRGLTLPRFVPSRQQRGSGIGQGPARPGDIIGEHPGQSSGSDGAGNKPGVDYIETEVSMEEIIEAMMDDLGLPRLDPKTVHTVAISMGYQIHGLKREGSPQLLARSETAKQGIKRFYGALNSLQKETGKDELTCFRALKQAEGVLSDAMAILTEDLEITLTDESVTPFPIIFNEDLRYYRLEERIEHVSNAVVIAMMDVSGSMNTMKKYIARSGLFWLVQFLRHLYDHVEIRFIVHHTEARIVEEEEFLKIGESGGTVCSSAYSLANALVENEYPTSRNNVYVVHFSDGDNYYSDADDLIFEVKKLIAAEVNMIGYSQINLEDAPSRPNTTLWSVFKDKLHLGEEKEDTLQIIVGDSQTPFLGVAITKKEELLPALRAFLKKTRWEQ